MLQKVGERLMVRLEVNNGVHKWYRAAAYDVNVKQLKHSAWRVFRFIRSA